MGLPGWQWIYVELKGIQMPPNGPRRLPSSSNPGARPVVPYASQSDSSQAKMVSLSWRIEDHVQSLWALIDGESVTMGHRVGESLRLCCRKYCSSDKVVSYGSSLIEQEAKHWGDDQNEDALSIDDPVCCSVPIGSCTGATAMRLHQDRWIMCRVRPSQISDRLPALRFHELCRHIYGAFVFQGLLLH